jgi:hypothetical protein
MIDFNLENLGVVGGMAAWGFIGIFKRAIILAVAFTLFKLFANNTAENNKKTEIVTNHIEEQISVTMIFENQLY